MLKEQAKLFSLLNELAYSGLYNLVQTYDPFAVSNSSFYIYNYARYPIACDKIFCLF